MVRRQQGAGDSTINKNKRTLDIPMGTKGGRNMNWTGLELLARFSQFKLSSHLGSHSAIPLALVFTDALRAE